MQFPVLDNLKQASELLTKTFEVNKTMLAGLLGVTERSMSEWEKMNIGNTSPKAKRLSLLYNLIRLIQKQYPNVPTKMYREILENSRVVIDNDDPEDGSISLLNMVISDPDEKYWSQIASSSIENYLEEIGFDLRKKRETSRSVQSRL